MFTPDPTPGPGANRPPRRRGPRRGNRLPGASGGLGEAVAQNANTPNVSLPQSPEGAAPNAHTHNTPEHPNHTRGGRNGRRGGFGRGGRRGGVQPLVNGQRVFGGELTAAPSNPPSASSVAGSLAADAPEFIPGRPIISRSTQDPNLAQVPRSRRMSKSQAPDIATRTHEDISSGNYECVICTNEVLPNSKIWSCKTCWSVLHLSCVKKWSKNEVSTHQQRATQNGELPPPRQWRCPGCNLPKEGLPENYTCWCEKETDPRSVPGLPPHSCGQSCSRSRQCPHPCGQTCHAGPCQPCDHMGPSLACFCGKETSTRRCVDTNYESGWSCGQICGDLLPCGEHTCNRGCHEGLCGSCEVLMESKCFCGQVEKALPCSDRSEERESRNENNIWIGSFDCGTECQRPYDCGKPGHFCKRTCHIQDRFPLHCPFSPDTITHCPCGKTPLSVLITEPRTSCTSPIPHCQEKCQKKLPCNHFCRQTCHSNDCGTCWEEIDIPCRCGRATQNMICHERSEEPPACERICRTALNCGRHECPITCCPGEKKAAERQALNKRKARQLNANRSVEENFEAEHICLKVCGRPLKCGSHFCQDLCHKGPCRSCLEAVFEDISCACGRTVLQPPQPCGTQPPPCHFDCTKPTGTCDHPRTKHQCHPDAVPCPKCPYLVEKPCVCGKRNLKNQPCWFTEVRCGLPCGKKLKCGNHYCRKQCHRNGECEDTASPCTQPCGRKKSVCDHTCGDSCHAPYPCKETTPCQAKTFITCECQHQKKPAQCLASKASDGNSKKTLDCNDECLRLQRNARFAAALNIDPVTHLDDHIPYSTQTLEFFKESTKFCQMYEKEFRVFAADPEEKRLRFKPMQANQRAFLHSLAEDYGFDSESQDPEPHRHVCIFKTPRFVSAPMKTLAQCVKIKPPTTAEPAPLGSRGLMTTAEPYNAFLLPNPRFGLTIDELHAELDPVASNFKLDVSFLVSGEVVVKATPSASGSWIHKTSLSTLKTAISKKVTDHGLGSSCILCSVDSNLNVLRRDDNGSAGGWSQVAKGALGGSATPKPTIGTKSSFTVLGKGLSKKKKEVQEDPVDDWEQAADNE